MPDDQARPAPESDPTFAGVAPPPAPDGKKRLRQRLFGGLAVVVLIGAVAFGFWWFTVGQKFVSTDDAYVGADVAQVTPRIDGTAIEVRVGDTQTVKAGDVLVRLDPTTLQLKVDEAEAQYAQAIRGIRQQVAVGAANSAEVGARQADIGRFQAQLSSAQADLDKARVDLDRRQALAASGAVSGDELTSAKRAFSTAEAALAGAKASITQAQASRAAAEGQRLAQSALVEGTSVENNPMVLAARAARDQARNDLSHTVIRAPIDGVIARRQIQVGQRVAMGASLMSVVPVGQVYVDANFKEVQLKKVLVGQPVTLESDIYGGKVVYHGKVAGIGGGTGSAFAVIPAQNATGNWIKVVQRLPVRVALDPREVKDHPLRVGLSMKAKIDISHPGA